MIGILKKKSVVTMFRPQIRSRHPSHSLLRTRLGLLPFRSIVRFGSTTIVEDNIKRIELNPANAIKISSNKRLMKQKFTEGTGVLSANWWTTEDGVKFKVCDSMHSGVIPVNIDKLEYPIVAKHIYGSRGEGNYLLQNKEELTSWLRGKTLANYIFEKFYNYNREYRLHVSEDGCFYTCRKMIKSDTPEDKRWFKNDSNSVWIMEENENFDKPVNWNTVVSESVKALKAVGLDFGAVDLRIQSSRDSKGKIRENPDFIVVEINSAPSFGDITLEKYLIEIPKMLRKKFTNQ